MTMIKRFESQDEFLHFRDHVKKVMAEKMMLTLKPRKVDELAAILAGAADFNTAMGLCAAKVPTPADPLPVVIPQAGELYFQIPATLMTGVGGFNNGAGRTTTFDAVEFFNNCVEMNHLHLMISWLDHPENAPGIGAANFARPTNAIIAGVLDECHAKNITYKVFIDRGALRDWLMSRGFTVMMSWLDALEMRNDPNPVTSFKEYVDEFSHALYHSDDEPDIASFKYMMGPEFVIKHINEGRRGLLFQWSYNGKIGEDVHSTQMGAIVEFLDSLGRK